MTYCPPCSRTLTQSNLLTHAHVLLECRVMEEVRNAQGITEFGESCR